jgi:outer membrane receptor for ferric coprogen and ferric-rhodotorulic acid
LAHRQICAFLLGMLLMSLACAAPDPSPRYELSIHAGVALNEALQELARQTGAQVVFFSEITAGRSSPELSGEYTLTAALTRLLEGSGLTFRQLDEHTVEVREAPPRSVRPPPRARQSATPTPAPDGPMEEVRVTATAEQLVATRVPTPLQEIPQSISIMSAEQIREQNSVDLGDVLENTPGIGVRQTSSLGVTGYSRAFAVTSFHVDGGAAQPTIENLILYQSNPDLGEFDHVEVLRGSDALFSSNSDPGGTVSLVRKRPLSTESLELSTTLGSWNNYRVELDATGPLTDNGALRARTDVVYLTRGYFFDRAHLDRKKLFAVVEYDFTPAATLTVGGSYEWDDALPLETPAITNVDGSGANLPLSLGLTFPWAFYNTRVGEEYVQYRQQFADDWILKLDATAGRTILDYGYGSFNGQYNFNHNLGSPSASFTTRPNQATLESTDATLTGKADWFGLREVIAIGGDFTRLANRDAGESYFAFGPLLWNPLTFNPAAYPDPRGTGMPGLAVDGRWIVEQYGGFALLQVDANDALSLTGGARVASDTTRLNGSVEGLGLAVIESSEESGNSGVVQPYAALLYRLNPHLSWYASYADIYLSQGAPLMRPDGKPLGPRRGITFESGIKGAWRDGALNGFLALYRIEQRGVPLPTGATISALNDCCYTSGAGRSRGVELQVDGELAPGWLIGSGYTFNLDKTGAAGPTSYPDEATPHHLLKIWTSARLPGAFSRWTTGGSLHAQTAAPGTVVYYCNAQLQNCALGMDVGTRPYAVFDLREGFKLNRNWQVALTVNNVLDKRYYLSQSGVNLWHGDPRNFMLRIDAKY